MESFLNSLLDSDDEMNEPERIENTAIAEQDAVLVRRKPPLVRQILIKLLYDRADCLYNQVVELHVIFLSLFLSFLLLSYVCSSEVVIRRKPVSAFVRRTQYQQQIYVWGR
ncbi:hypothetical protein D3C78_1569740 [compost metagenome]